MTLGDGVGEKYDKHGRETWGTWEGEVFKNWHCERCIYKWQLKIPNVPCQYRKRILWTCQNKSVSQGFILVPLFFICIKDLQQALSKSQVRLYDDDAYVLFFHQTLAEIALSVSEAFSNRFNWFIIKYILGKIKINFFFLNKGGKEKKWKSWIME